MGTLNGVGDSRMDEYPVVDKLCSWPTVVGFVAGAFVVSFVVYPPHVGWGESMKWGDVATWIGAVMSGGAAIAAWYAARIALKLGRLPVDQQEAFRAAKARAIATAIFPEVNAARALMLRAKDLLLTVQQEDAEAAKFAVLMLRLDKVAMTERFLAEISVFGEKDASMNMLAASEMMNFNSEMESIMKRLDSRISAAMRGAKHVPEAVGDAMRLCDVALGAIDHAFGVLVAHIAPKRS